MKRSLLSIMCACMLVSNSISLPAIAMHGQDTQGGQVEKVEKTAEGEAHSGAIVVPIAVAGGDGDSDHQPRQPPRTNRVPLALLAGYSIVATAAICGLIGGWVGEHYTRSPCQTTCPNATEVQTLAEFCRVCFQNCTF